MDGGSADNVRDLIEKIKRVQKVVLRIYALNRIISPQPNIITHKRRYNNNKGYDVTDKALTDS